MESSISGKFPGAGTVGGTGAVGPARTSTTADVDAEGAAISPFQRLIVAADDAKGDGDAPDSTLLMQLAPLVDDAEGTDPRAGVPAAEESAEATGAVAALAALLSGEQVATGEAQKAERPALRLVSLKLAGAAGAGANGQGAQSASGARLLAGFVQNPGEAGAGRAAVAEGALANASLSTTTTVSNMPPPPAGTPAQAPISPGRSGFDGAMAQQVRWLVERGIEQAELRLEPPSLGRIGVRLRLEGDQAMLSFHSAHAPVREAVESAVPRLRELLADAGIELAGVEVGSDGDARQDGRRDEVFQESEHAAGSTAGADTDGADAGSGPPDAQAGTGLFDAYA